MSTFTIIAIIAGIILLIGIIWVTIYNRLIKKRNWTEEAYSQIDVQLQRRNDLIPNLVSTVKGYTQHESSTLEAVTEARQQLVNLPADASIEQVNQLSNQLTQALSRLIAVSESYPELKADTHFANLQASLETIEKDIAVARQLYNSAVTEYNTAIETVPNNLVAGASGFERKPVLQTPADQQEVPTVQF